MGQSQLIIFQEATLTIPEQEQLATNEAVIERGIQTFYEVGMALTEIREHRLYRAVYGTFEEYCLDRWGFQRRQGQLLMKAAEVVDNLKLRSMDRILPTSERQARPLSTLDPDQQAEAWQRAVDTAPNGIVTGGHVQRIVDEVKAPTMAVHYSSATPEWYTPRHIVDRVVSFFDAIDLDPCSNSHDAPNVPAGHAYTESDDGLAQPWFGRVYVNPPYGEGIGRWTEKARSEYEASRNQLDRDEPDMLSVEAVIMLLPARVDTEWFRVLRDYAVCFLRGRLKFVGAESSAPFPSMMVYLGDEVDRFAKVMQPIGDVWMRRK